MSQQHTVRVNMAQMSRWKVTSDSVRAYDSIMRSNGVILTLDHRAYTEPLCDFGIFYTLSGQSIKDLLA